MSETLTEAVERIYGCKARHLRSAEVCKMSAGQAIWEGIVEVFELIGHPEAKKCYAWNHWVDQEGEHNRVMTVLGIPPVDSPSVAVRVATGTTKLARVPRSKTPPG